MKYFIILLILIGFVGIGFAEEHNFCTDGSLVIFNYTMTNGKLNSMCLDRDENFVTVKIDAIQDGNLTIDVPRNAVNAIISCEKDDDFFVIIDGREVNYTETKSTEKFRQISISFTSDSQEIEIIGIIVGFPPTNCAYLYEYDQINIPPRQQIKLGISSQNIICEAGLELIQKYDGTPACVKEQTRIKLIERGWTIKPYKPVLSEDMLHILKENLENIKPEFRDEHWQKEMNDVLQQIEEMELKPEPERTAPP